MKTRCMVYVRIDGRDFRCAREHRHRDYHHVTTGVQDARWPETHQSTERQENR